MAELKKDIKQPDRKLFLHRWTHLTALMVLAAASISPVRSAPVQLVEQPPASMTNIAPGIILVDFGRVAFGNLQLNPATNSTNTVTIHFGEAFADGRINRKPPGSVRYAKMEARLDGAKPLVIAPMADKRNTTQPAVLTPPEWGVALPFRSLMAGNSRYNVESRWRGATTGCGNAGVAQSAARDAGAPAP